MRWLMTSVIFAASLNLLASPSKNFYNLSLESKCLRACGMKQKPAIIHEGLCFCRTHREFMRVMYPKRLAAYDKFYEVKRSAK